MRLHRDLLDRRFDKRLGLDTCGRHWQSELDLAGENARFAIEYEPTPKLVFRRMIGALDIDLRRFVFIDLGSGKGRMLVLASELSFKRVEGIELSSRMHEIAVKNIAVLGERAAKVMSHNIDATCYEFPNDPCVIFAFNPFQGKVVSSVLANLNRSLMLQPREGYVLYLNPRHRDLFDNSDTFEELRRSRFRKLTDWFISP